jgi:hypothetical protein
MRMNQRRFGMVLFSALLLSGAMACAADRVWNGPATGDWFTVGHWLPNDNFLKRASRWKSRPARCW